nr:CPPV045 hypothetical protein [Cooks petrelpox virus]WIK87343.1 hypothetical protein TDPV-045 [Oriental turtle dovepox virus]
MHINLCYIFSMIIKYLIYSTNRTRCRSPSV